MTELKTIPNEVRRFIVENQPVRGYWVDLESAWQDLRAHQDYPAAVRDLLGEAVSASVLLAATLKFQGTLTLQLEGQGQVRLLVAQCTHDFRVRGVARLRGQDVDEESDEDDTDDAAAPDSLASAVADAAGATGEDAGGAPGFEHGRVIDLGALASAERNPFALPPQADDSAAEFRRLVGEDGRIVVTIEASEKEMRYQGIVPLTGSSLSECLEEYFASSEQLPTRVRLAADGRRAVGLLVQKLPERGGEEARPDSAAAAAWRDAERGIQAVQTAQLLGTSLQSLLESRFGRQDLRVFKGAPVQFSCRCSLARVAGLLKTLGQDEVRDVLREQGAVEVTCEFCQRPYRFDAVAVEQLFAPDSDLDRVHSLH
ncbi:MAG: Hsp33 family molecular chaperone HslO [Steroidobacteraceae bacterium]|nr:Hsp33 family molecular chaperone HslO [Steroidobacteraceae bacterium]